MSTGLLKDATLEMIQNELKERFLASALVVIPHSADHDGADCCVLSHGNLFTVMGMLGEAGARIDKSIQHRNEHEEEVDEGGIGSLLKEDRDHRTELGW